jgi:enterobactin synthetase component D
MQAASLICAPERDAFWRACGGLIRAANSGRGDIADATVPSLQVCEHWCANAPLPWQRADIPVPEGFAAKRANDFVAGRACALAALARHNKEVNTSASVLGRGAGGEPIWPTGVVGSISHTHQYAVAVLASKQSVVSVGVDVEMRRVLSARAQRRVCTVGEQERIATLAPAEQALHALILFSAKESIYKCLYQAVALRPGFADAALCLEALSAPPAPSWGRIAVSFLGGVAAGIERQRLQGCYAVFDQYVATFMVLSAPEAHQCRQKCAGN